MGEGQGSEETFFRKRKNKGRTGDVFCALDWVLIRAPNFTRPEKARGAEEERERMDVGGMMQEGRKEGSFGRSRSSPLIWFVSMRIVLTVSPPEFVERL
mmetsp:Transcript_25784/g.50483  ORF Transcript_25784/g.50483 Transcript_25784/m.50483 type:complete len:99 (+) Transcript_25784:460-756(+)